MKFRRRFKKIGLILIVFLAVQTVTYFLFAHKMLKGKLMAHMGSGRCDSLFVRDFYSTDCYTGDDNTYYSHHLTEDEIKERWGVKYVRFQNTGGWDTDEDAGFPVEYDTWVAYNYGPLGIFGSDQVETISSDARIYQGRTLYERYVHYRWFLFFWIPVYTAENSTYVTPRWPLEY
jgi:hypothetical protein